MKNVFPVKESMKYCSRLRKRQQTLCGRLAKYFSSLIMCLNIAKEPDENVDRMS